MEYETLTDVPEAIREYYKEEVRTEPSGEMEEVPYTVIDDEGNEVESTKQVPVLVDNTYVVLVNRSECKHISDLERVYNLGKPQRVLDMFAEKVVCGTHWEWFDTYSKYLSELALYKEAYEAIEAAGALLDEEGEEIAKVYPVEPKEPVRSPSATVDEILAVYKADPLEQRKVAYADESDGLYMEWQFDGSTESEQAWRDKVSEIKLRYPKS